MEIVYTLSPHDQVTFSVNSFLGIIYYKTGGTYDIIIIE